MAHRWPGLAARRWSLNPLMSVAIASIATAAGLAAAEGVLRIFSIGPEVIVIQGTRMSPDEVLVYELAPGASVAEDHILISSSGLRDREYPEAKPPDAYRIALVGDSVAYGYRVQQPATMAKILERLLQRLRPNATWNYEVLNFGVSGYNSKQIARYIETGVIRFEPDLVVYVYCLNDPEDFVAEIAGLAAHGRSGWWHMRTYRLLRSVLDSRGANASNPSAADSDSPAYFLSLHADGPRWNRTQKDFRRMGSLVRGMGGTFVAVVSPLLWDPHAVHDDQYDEPLRSTMSRVVSALRQSGASVLDFAPAAAAYSRTHSRALGIDQVHYSETGHQLAALAILDHLLRESLLPDSAAFDLRSAGRVLPELQALLDVLR